MANKTFEPLTSKPSKRDKYIYLYNNESNGGLSKCIAGKPEDKDCNVLCNCVGWACGRFNHIYNILSGFSGIKYPNFYCNAENFIEVAKNYGLSIGQEPQIGSIMVWQKGSTLQASDGAGHVAIVESVNSSTQVTTSESGYGSFAFDNKVRNKGSGNWGTSDSYTFRGFIYNPACSEINKNSTKIENPIDESKSIKSKDSSVNQILVQTSNLRVRVAPNKNANIVGYAYNNMYYNYDRVVKRNGFKWYRIGAGRWIAFDPSWATFFKAEKKFRVNDVVTITNHAPIYGQSKEFPSWVYNNKLYVRSVEGNKIEVSIYKKGAITGSVDRRYLVKL